jgi:hypothetical protein
MANLPTYFLDPDLVRGSEVSAADWTGGMNKAASNAPGIGINTGEKAPKADDWTTLDQAGAARTPQQSQHIGTAPDDINVIQGSDVNDSVSFIAAVVQATPGNGMGAAGADPINRSDFTVAVGERAWGTNTVV